MEILIVQSYYIYIFNVYRLYRKIIANLLRKMLK